MGKGNVNEYDYEALVKRVAWLVLIVGAILLGIYFGKFGGRLSFDSLGTQEHFGAFGDFVGGLMNPLLQFIVISMLLWSIRIQQKELRETREELTESRKANQLSASALQTQAEFQRTQLELATLKQLSEQSFTQLFKLSTSGPKKAFFDVCIYDEHLFDLTMNDLVDLMNTKGFNSIEFIVIGTGSIGAEPSFLINANQLLVKQLELLDKYAFEKGSIYFVEAWLEQLLPFILFFKRLDEELGVFTCLGIYNDTTSTLSERFEDRGLDFQPLARKYCLHHFN